MRFYGLLFVVLTVAHPPPGTDKEIEVQRRLQAAAYHCAPDIAQFMAGRKRQFVLSGQPRLHAYDDLFTSYKDKFQIHHDHQSLTSCTPVERGSYLQNNNCCVLAPVVTEGPLYYKEGHIIRQDIAENQDGLPLLLDIGVIDVNTCQPLPNVLVDLWQANATGYYSGQSEDGSAGVRTKFSEFFLRGAWPTDYRGVVRFFTIFPGYYPLRATHIHTKVFTQWETLPNGTFRSDKLIHVGQFFFDNDINVEIDKMYPYSTNPVRDTYGRTPNDQDAFNIFQDSHAPEGKYNPIFNVEMLGGVINQGLIAYITMGINSSATYIEH